MYAHSSAGLVALVLSALENAQCAFARVKPQGQIYVGMNGKLLATNQHRGSRGWVLVQLLPGQAGSREAQQLLAPYWCHADCLSLPLCLHGERGWCRARFNCTVIVLRLMELIAWLSTAVLKYLPGFELSSENMFLPPDVCLPF